jgi:site-specific DNA-methyltransferase (adenine-specific)
VKPYYQHAGITIYYGDCREILPKLAIDVDVTLADPPTGETALEWDKWPRGWVASLPGSSLWCFGTLRMFRAHFAEFQEWKLAQDIVWEKHNGSGMMADRFRRVHEQVAQFYRGKWSAVFHEAQKTFDATARTIRRKQKLSHWSKIKSGHFTATDGGARLMRSVLRIRSEHGRAENETQKPLALLRTILAYSCPKSGLVLDPMAGSGSTLVAAKSLGMRGVGIETREPQCEIAAKRLSQEILQFESVGTP